MKTPREILLARHRAIEPKLDLVRETALAVIRDQQTANDRACGQPSNSAADTIFQTLWRELFLPCRQVWKGLAVVWCLLFILNLAQRHESGPRVIASGPSAPLLLAYYQQEKMLNELLSDHALPVNGDRPRSAISRATTI